MGFSGVVQQIKDLVTRVTNLDNSLIDRIYPVGSIYMSMVSTNPATLLGGGTWEQLPTGRCIIGANGTDYNAGDVVIFEKNNRLMVGVIEGYYMEDDIFWFNIRVSSRYVYTYSNGGDIMESDIIGRVSEDLKEELIRQINNMN